MNTFDKDFVPYQESLELKELGFDEPCIMQWTYAPELIFCTSAWGHPKLKTNKESYSDSGGDCISAPTFSQAFRWFREKYGLHGSVTPLSYEILEKDNPDGYWGCIVEVLTDTYDELPCLRKLIEIVKR